jgi:hypothetical protein
MIIGLLIVQVCCLIAQAIYEIKKNVIKSTGLLICNIIVLCAIHIVKAIGGEK